MSAANTGPDFIDNNSWATIWILQLLQQTPVLLVYLLGMAVAMIRWSRHPQVSLLVFVAMGIMLFTSIVGSALTHWIVTRAVDSGAMNVSSMLNVVNVVRMSVWALANLLLLAAIFGWRGERRG